MGDLNFARKYNGICTEAVCSEDVRLEKCPHAYIKDEINERWLTWTEQDLECDE
jgi:hypothetical protein